MTEERRHRPAGRPSGSTPEEDVPIVIIPDGVDLSGCPEWTGEEPPPPDDETEQAVVVVDRPKAPAPPAPRIVPRKTVPIPKPPPEPPPVEEDGPESDEEADRRYQEQLLRDMEAELEREIGDELAGDRSGWESITVPRVFRLIGVVALAALSVLWLIGRPYYTLEAVQRPFHHLHGLLRPSGTIGLTMGLAGVLLMAVSLGYLARKSLIGWLRLRGGLQGWLGFHIFAGLLGSAAVFFHGNFDPHSALGFLALVSVLVILGSGFLGRYIYIHVPRTLQGRELEIETVRRRLDIYRRKLTDLGVEGSLLEGGEDVRINGHPWIPRSIVGLIYGDRETKEDFARLRDKVFAGIESHAQADRILVLVERLSRERRWVVRYREFRHLIGTWRFIHRWLAVVLMATVLFHIVLSLRFGDLWICFWRR